MDAPSPHAPPEDTPADIPNPNSQSSRFLRTVCNIFGVVRGFFSNKAPSHDPEEFVTLEQLSPNVPDQNSDLPVPTSALQFHPYPNKNSFRLGDWYWNGGTQKSKHDFRDLVDIIGNPQFNPTDVCHMNWDAINEALGSSADREEGHSKYKWMDEDVGWKHTWIKISVPFHNRMATPGVGTYASVDLHHRLLVPVIKERLANPDDAVQFHLEPYELLWKLMKHHKEVKFHGEMYTSEAFINAHHELQESPCEPNCDLP